MTVLTVKMLSLRFSGFRALCRSRLLRLFCLARSLARSVFVSVLNFRLSTAICVPPLVIEGLEHRYSIAIECSEFTVNYLAKNVGLGFKLVLV